MANHTITISLSEAARRAALVAGESGARRQTYPVVQEDMPRLLALPWTHLSPAGVASCEVPPDMSAREEDYPWTVQRIHRSGCNLDSTESSVADARPASGTDAIAFAEGLLHRLEAEHNANREARARRRAERTADEIATAVRWANLPLAWRASVQGIGTCEPMDRSESGGYSGPLATSGYAVYASNLLRRHVPEAYQEAEAEVARLRAERDAAAARAEQERKVMVRRLVADHGTPDQIERYDSGVLPPEELSALIEEQLFAPLSSLPRWVPLADSDVSHSDGCEDPDVKFSGKAYKGTLTAEQWARRKAILAAAPEGAEVEARVHSGHCRDSNCEDSSIESLGVRVTLEFAGEEYSREYAI